MVIKKKEHFYSLTTTDVHIPPRLTLQVWDNDFFSPDDYIGESFNMNRGVLGGHAVVYV